MKTGILKSFIAAIAVLIISGYCVANGQAQDDSASYRAAKEKECYDKSYEKLRMVYLRIVRSKLEYHEEKVLSDLETLRLQLRSIKAYCEESLRIDMIDKEVDKVLAEYYERQAAARNQNSSAQHSDNGDKKTSSSASSGKVSTEEEYRLKVNNDIINRNYESAVENCNKLISIVPDYSAYYWTRASLYYELKKYSSAIPDYTSYIKYLSKDSTEQLATAYFNRANCKTRLSDHYGALDDLNKALEIMPGSSHIYNQIAWEKFLMKNYSEALKNADKAVECDPSDYNAVDTRAEIKLNIGDYKGCLADCERVLKVTSIPNTYLVRGRALYRLGDRENACKSWSKAGELGVAEAYDYISKYCK